MPELPEVETIRRMLEPVLSGSRLLMVLPGEHPEVVLMPWPLFQRAVRGRRIEQLERRGKYLALRLDTDQRLVFHLGMTGELRLSRPEAPVSRHCHVALVVRPALPMPPALADRRGRLAVRFVDVRRFGHVALLSPAEWAALSGRLGSEPLDPALTPQHLWERLRTHRMALKAALLDQSVVAGIGNIYADEALFVAGLHPARRTDTVTLEEAERLLAALRRVLSAAIASRGTTIRDYRDAQGQRGGYQRQLQVYGRPPGAPCPHCGTSLERLRLAGRSTTFCPRCQPAG